MTQHEVKILKDVVGHNDMNGAVDATATKYKAGETYHIGDGLLKTFIEIGVVELVTGKNAEPKPASKNPAEEREKKVVAPKEAKPANPKPASKNPE